MKKVLIISLIILIIDQIIKLVIVGNIDLNSEVIVINNFFSLTNIKNTGAAFNILSDMRLILIFITTLAIAFLLRYIDKLKKIDLLSLISYSLIVGGACGNLIDRIFRGYVVDYLSFNISGINTPVFNFADACVVIGAILFMIVIMKESGSNGKNKSRRKTTKN